MNLCRTVEVERKLLENIRGLLLLALWYHVQGEQKIYLYLDVAELTRDKGMSPRIALLDKGLGPGQGWVSRRPDKFPSVTGKLSLETTQNGEVES